MMVPQPQLCFFLNICNHANKCVGSFQTLIFPELNQLVVVPTHHRSMSHSISQCKLITVTMETAVRCPAAGTVHMLFFLQPSQPISATPANIGALSQVEAPIGLIGGLGESTFVAVGVGGLVSRSRSKRTSAVNTLSLIRPPRLNNMISMGNKTVKRVQVYWMLWREDLHRLYEV